MRGDLVHVAVTLFTSSLASRDRLSWQFDYGEEALFGLHQPPLWGIIQQKWGRIAGVISKGEMETQLAKKYPQYDISHERTLRRWAHQKCRELPEQRHKLLGPQQLDWEPSYVPVASSFQGMEGVPMAVLQQVPPVMSSSLPVASEL